MPVRHTSFAVFAACFTALHSGPQAAESIPSDSPPAASAVESNVAASSGPIPTPTDNLRSIPQNAYESRPALGVPMRSIFRDTRAPYYDNLRDWSLSPSARLSETAGITSMVDLPDFRGSFPLLQRGFAPEEADLKIGPVYFKLGQVSLAALASDNINLSHDDREADVIGIVSIGGQILAQLSEGFRIAVSGNFAYLPFESEAGAEGFALRAPYSFGLASVPVVRSQVAWTPVIFGLPITLADEFRVGMARFRNGAYDGFALYEGEDFNSVDRAGYYSVRARQFTTGDEFNDRNYNDETEFLFYSNEISLSTGADLPGQNVFRFRASHENIWYHDEDESLQLPTERDQVIASIHSVRENLRFKPHLTYEFFRRNNPDVSDHQVWAGVTGPVTDLMQFRGELGMYWADNGNQSLLWRAGLFHRPSPTTWHTLVYSRALSEFHEELDQNVAYRISKVLGPELTMGAYSSYHWIEDLLGDDFNRTEWRNGLRLTYFASPKTIFQLLGEQVMINYDNEADQSMSWRARAQCTHRFHERLLARAIYQYQLRDSDNPSDSYYENLAYLSVSWLFH